MKKILLTMCFLGATNLFAEACGNFCSSIVFEKDSAYIKPYMVPGLKAVCQNFILEKTCEDIEFRDDGTAWLKGTALEDYREYCLAASREENCQKEEVSSFWEQFIKAASTVTWRH